MTARGMAQEDLDHVFDRFVRRDDTRRRHRARAVDRALAGGPSGRHDRRAQPGGRGHGVHGAAAGRGAGLADLAPRGFEGSAVLVLTPARRPGGHADGAGRGRRRQGQGAGDGQPASTTCAPSATTCCCWTSRALAIPAWGFWPGCARPELGRRPLVTVCGERQDQALCGRVAGRADVDAEALAGTLGAAIVAERSSILVVGRSAVRERVEAELLATGPGPPVGHHRDRRGTGVPPRALRGRAGGRGHARRRRGAGVARPARQPSREGGSSCSPRGSGFGVEHPSVRATVPLEQGAAAVVAALAEAPAASLDQG